MRLVYLILLILTNALTAFSTTVIVDPYRDLDYEGITTYEIGRDTYEDEPCPPNDYLPYGVIIGE